jgi:hypothetical protein
MQLLRVINALEIKIIVELVLFGESVAKRSPYAYRACHLRPQEERQSYFGWILNAVFLTSR